MHLRSQRTAVFWAITREPTVRDIVPFLVVTLGGALVFAVASRVVANRKTRKPTPATRWQRLGGVGGSLALTGATFAGILLPEYVVKRDADRTLEVLETGDVAAGTVIGYEGRTERTGRHSLRLECAVVDVTSGSYQRAFVERHNCGEVKWTTFDIDRPQRYLPDQQVPVRINDHWAAIDRPSTRELAERDVLNANRTLRYAPYAILLWPLGLLVGVGERVWLRRRANGSVSAN